MDGVLGKGNTVPAMLRFYHDECVRQGATREQTDAVGEMIQHVHEWRVQNPTLCKTPDVQPGEITT